MKHRILYGKGGFSVDIPDERLVGILAPKEVKPVADMVASVRASIARPFESDPLAQILKGKKTALIVTVDKTRPSPEPMIRPMLDLCDKDGIRVTVIIANGRHRLMTDEEVRRHLGARIMKTCRVMQHDAFDEKSMKQVGKTGRGTAIRVNKVVFEHDVVIGCGIIEPSYLCGWSGGRKLLMPGLAHHVSIDNNHYYLTHPDTKIGRLHNNPVSDDAAEFASKLPLHFIVYSISGPNDETVKVVSGHPVKAHERACELCERIYRVKPLYGDIVISSAGGAPYDCDLVQGKKAIIPAIQAVKRNGVVILCAECPEGLGAEQTFVNWLHQKTPVEVVRDVMDRKQFNLGAHGANILARPIAEKNAKIILVTNAKVAALMKGTYVIPTTRLADAWKLANLIAGKDSSVLLIEKARRLILN